MIGRLLNKALPRLLSADMIGLVLLDTALQAFTYGIASSLRNVGAQESTYFFLVCLIAALIALGLNKLKLNGIQASVGVILIGILGVWILGARLVSPLLALGNAIIHIFPQIIPALRSELPMDTTSITDAWLIVAEASNALGIRVQAWLMGLGRNITVNDALVRNLAWTLIMWLMAAWMGWFARPGASSLGVIGCGWQARSQLAAVRAALPGLERALAWCRTPDRLAPFCAETGAEPAERPQQAGGCDVVATATTSRDPVLRGDWLAEGALVCAIGANDPRARELDNVVHSPASGGEPRVIPQDPRAPRDGGADGWQYTEDGTRIRLCGATCEQVRADRGARLDVVVGCPVRGVE